MEMTPDELLELYDRHARELIGWLAARTRDPQLALDLLSETFLAAFEHRAGCRATTAGQRAAWLYRIAANRLVDHGRAGARERSAMSRLATELRGLHAEEIAEIERLAADEEIQARVVAALGDLTVEQRDAVRLRFLHGRSYSDIARRLGVSEQSVRARVSRGLRALRRVTGAHDEEECR